MEHSNKNRINTLSLLLHTKQDIILSPLQKKVYKYIKNNYHDVAFMTIKQLAKAINVSPATIVRSISRLGYINFQSLKDEIRKVLLSTAPTIWPQLEKSWSSLESNQTLEKTIYENIETLRSMLNPSFLSSYKKALALLFSAKKIFILGMRTSEGPAWYFYFLLHQFLPTATWLCRSGTEAIYEDLIEVTPKDIIVTISHAGPMYTVRTINAVKYAYKNNLNVLLITDNFSNPAIRYATEVLIVTGGKSHYSAVPLMTLFDSLIIDIGRKNRKDALTRLRSISKLKLDNNISVKLE